MDANESVAYAKQARNANGAVCHECVNFNDCMNMNRTGPYNKFCTYEISRFELNVSKTTTGEDNG